MGTLQSPPVTPFLQRNQVGGHTCSLFTPVQSHRKSHTPPVAQSSTGKGAHKKHNDKVLTHSRVLLMQSIEKIILRHFGLNSALWRTSIDGDWLQSQPVLQGVSFEKHTSLGRAMESHVPAFPHITRESLINSICLNLLQSSHSDTLVRISLFPELMTRPKHLHLATDQKKFISSYTVMSSSAKSKEHLTNTFCLVGIFDLFNPKHSLGKW